MQWLETLDVALFRWINRDLSNPVFDAIMPFLSGNAFFFPAVAVLAGYLVWKGRARAVAFLLLLALAIALADGAISNTLKHAIGRERPFLALPDVNCLLGKSGSGSMPSSHAANWFAATMVALLFYRRSVWITLPLALLVSFSRVYNGVHYPSDVLAGAFLGAGAGTATVLGVNACWHWVGRKWFPLWWERAPSVLLPERPRGSGEDDLEDPDPGPPLVMPKVRGLAPAGFQAPHVSLDQHWLRLGYVLIGLLLVGRLAYIASDTIQLSEDEAYQWVWSKNLALSYYSKPPMIAYTQFLGTSLWGDREFGVRFFSPIIAAIMSLLVLRFFGREVNARAGFFLLLITCATPLLSVGSTLMTVDPLSVLFWTAAMLAGWTAVQPQATTRAWLWVGLWMGLGFLSKYTALLQFLCWAVFFALWRPARQQLRRPGPYLAVLVTALCSVPVLIWNAQHQWITVEHVGQNAGVHKTWHPTLKFLGEFLGAEFGLLNPVFFVASVWAAIAFWRRGRHNPRLVYFFSMGAPLFLVYFLYSFRSRIFPNWIAPSVLPLFCLMVAYWDTQLRLGMERVKHWLATGLLVGFAMVLVLHETNWVQKVTGNYLPVALDPLHRVREWDTTARVVNQARETLQSEGKPVFIIGDHYGITGQLSFYVPEARTRVKHDPLVYFRTSTHPLNQFYFLPGYTHRKGENAIAVVELNRKRPDPGPPPEVLVREFESVTDLGVTNVLYHGQFLLRPLQLFACRGLK
jgi:membrane-associated phospholipid phosphatase